MTKLLGILMMVGVLVGCGGDSPTGEEKRELLVWTTERDLKVGPFRMLVF